ncbi:MAG: HlyD family efflux transporter periplasmic adaptor subunit [Deltaproteobacteria bacterium]|nr:HlyD family efflux transporter periplasmic adaptor subunit [Deltaproteobacteria bacterium]
MSESLFSNYWYRVADLKPALRDSTVVSRHRYRGELWYVLRNALNGRSHRFNAAAYRLIGRMDGRRTVQQLWDLAEPPEADPVPTQDEMIRLLGRLHEAELMQCDILPGTADLFRQLSGPSAPGRQGRFSNIFCLRFPLCDPDPFLKRWSHFTAPLFTRGALLAWSLAVLTALAAALMNGPELAAAFDERLLQPGNLLLLWIAYPLVKAFHELAHALAVKKWGGEVHELGIMLLALTPIPYVDATSSGSFPEKERRIAVAAAGMMVELLLAALALWVWLNVENGLIAALAYNVMLIGSASTLLFNGNPLLRYDGYYILSDWLEIPNLAQRSNRYLAYLAQRHFLGVETAASPIAARGEKIWFLLYGPLSGCYRIAVLVGLVWLVSGQFFIIGLLIAVWGAVSLLILPALRGVVGFLDSPAARSRRSRLMAIGGGAMAGLMLILFVFPMPFWTTAQGVVQLPEQSVIRAGADCEVMEVLQPVRKVVDQGTPLLKGSNPFLEAEIGIRRAHLEELFAGYHAQPLHERLRRKMLLEEIERNRADLLQLEEQMEKLLVRSPVRGQFVLLNERNLPGHFVRQGELLGYMVAEHRPTIRAVVSQADIGLIRQRVTGVEVRLAEALGKPLKAQIERIIPAAELNLPSAALGTAGGGPIPVDPNDPEKRRALESHFQLDLSLPEEVREPHIGGRVHIRFEHGHMPWALQWYRTLRQLFLRKFYV